jgi:hypothetical protein
LSFLKVRDRATINEQKYENDFGLVKRVGKMFTRSSSTQSRKSSRERKEKAERVFSSMLIFIK